MDLKNKITVEFIFWRILSILFLINLQQLHRTMALITAEENYIFNPLEGENDTSLAAQGALAHHLHCLQNPKWPLGGPKIADGVWKDVYLGAMIFKTVSS